MKNSMLAKFWLSWKQFLISEKSEEKRRNCSKSVERNVEEPTRHHVAISR